MPLTADGQADVRPHGQANIRAHSQANHGADGQADVRTDGQSDARVTICTEIKPSTVVSTRFYFRRFPSGCVVVYKGNDRYNTRCECDPFAVNIAPVCCDSGNSCFRRSPPSNSNTQCLAGLWNQASFESLSWYEAANKCEEHGWELCSTPPSNVGNPSYTAPNCRGSGCSYDSRQAGR